MGHLYLLRHGQSTWNHENRFTGWVDVPITEQGKHEMLEAAKMLYGVRINGAYASALYRTRMSARIVLDATCNGSVFVLDAWELNERAYGRLTGLNKEAAAREYGEELVHQWRRSYSVRPPGGESLEDAAARILPFFCSVILPRVRLENRILVCAHGNTLRAIRMKLDDLDGEQVARMEIPTGGLCRYGIGRSGEVLDFAQL